MGTLEALVSKIRALGLKHASRHESGGADELSLSGMSPAAILESLMDANTIIKADSDDTPVALEIAASRIVARLAAGGIVAATVQQVLNLLLTTQDDIIVRGAANPERLNIAASRIVGKKAAGNVAGLTKAEVLALLNVEDGADVTDATNVDAAGAIMESDVNFLDAAMLSQDFGASSVRLRNHNQTPIAGNALKIDNAAKSVFSGDINAGGTGGLTATNVPYDGDSKEDMFNGLRVYDGTNYWGQIVLHNTTRGNSRKIVSVDRANNAITTTSSTDDWADDDVITCQSQTNTLAGAFDLDLSAQVGTSIANISLRLTMRDNEGAADANRYLMIMSYADWPQPGWIAICQNKLANEGTEIFPIIAIIGQSVTLYLASGTEDAVIEVQVMGVIEYADT